MGNVIAFPARHARASTGCAKPKRAGSASLSIARKASDKTMKCFDGMNRRSFQFEMAGAVTPAKEQTDEGPPSAVTISSTDFSIPYEYSRFVNMSSVHETGIAPDAESAIIHGMQSPRIIAARLAQTREALGLKAADLCRQTGIAPNAWSQFESGERPITIKNAVKLCETYGLTLDWIYRGDAAGLPQRVFQQIKVSA